MKIHDGPSPADEREIGIVVIELAKNWFFDYVIRCFSQLHPHPKRELGKEFAIDADIHPVLAARATNVEAVKRSE